MEAYTGQVFGNPSWDGVGYLWLKHATSWGYGDGGGHVRGYAVCRARFEACRTVSPITSSS